MRIAIPALCLLLLFSFPATSPAAGLFDFNLPSLEQLLEKASVLSQDESSETHKLYVRAREMETSKSDHTPEEQAGITAMYLEAANAGHWKAKAHMVYRYANGIGIERNVLLAADLAKELAKDGASDGLNHFTEPGANTSGNEQKKDEPMPAMAEGSPLSVREEGAFPDSPTPERQGSPVLAGRAVTAPDLTPVRVDGKYGYITSQGEWSITPRYDAANPFSANGLAWVQHQGRYGVVNTAGEWILPAEIDRIGQFSADGLAQASKDGLVGFVDTAGNWTVPPEYVAVFDFAENGLARVCLRPENPLMHELSKGPKGLADIAVNLKSSSIMLWGFVDKKGNRVIPVELEGASDFGPNGLAAARKKASMLDSAWGYIDASGNWVIAPQFFSASIFNESGVALVQRSATEHAGLIDQTGAFLIEPGYHNSRMFTLLTEEPGADGGVKRTAVLPFMHEKKWGAIGLDGRWTVMPELEELSPFNDDGLAIATAGGKRGIINAKGNWIFQPVYADIRPFARNELAIAVGENGKLGVVNRNGDWILKPEIDVIRPIITNNGIIPTAGFGRIDRQGRRVYVYENFDGRWTVRYANDYRGTAVEEKEYMASKASAAVWPALAVVYGKYGYINSQGQWAVKPSLDDARPFNANGLASVKKGGKYGLMDGNGAWVCAPKFDEIGYYNNGQFSPYGLAIAMVGGRCGYIDMKGNWIIPPYLEHCHDFQDCGLAWAKTEKGPDGILDARGSWVVSPEANYSDQYVYASAGVIRVYRNSKYGLVSLSGEVLSPLQFDVLQHLDGSDFFYAQQDGLSGVIDRRGYWVIRPHFKVMGEYIGERIVEMKALTSFSSKYYLGRSGNLIVPVGERFSEAATPLRREIQKDRHVLVNDQGESVLTIVPSSEGDRATNAKGEIIWPLSKNE